VKVKLATVAHSRAGDKGVLVTLSLIPYDPGDYEPLCRVVTAERVREHLADRVDGEVVRHELPNLPALLFVCQRSTQDTVTASLYLDAHAKSLSSALLEMVIELPGGKDAEKDRGRTARRDAGAADGERHRRAGGNGHPGTRRAGRDRSHPR